MKHVQPLFYAFLGVLMVSLTLAQTPTGSTGTVDTVDPALTDVASTVTSGSGSIGQPDAIAPDSFFLGSPTNLDQAVTAPPPQDPTTAAPTTASSLSAAVTTAAATASGSVGDPGPPLSPDQMVGGGGGGGSSGSGSGAAGSGASVLGVEQTTAAAAASQDVTTASPAVVVTQAPPIDPTGTSAIEAEVRETVYAMLNESGSLMYANDANVEELVQLLMNGTVITDADLIRLGFMPPPLPPTIPVVTTPPPYVFPGIPGVDLSGATNPVPATGTGTTSTQAGTGTSSGGSVVPPSITDIFGIPGSAVVPTGGSGGTATGGVSTPGAGSTTGGGVIAPQTGTGATTGVTDPLGSLFSGMAGTGATSVTDLIPNALTNPSAVIPNGALATPPGPLPLPGLGTTGAGTVPSPNDISSQQNLGLPSAPNALGPKPTDPFGGLGGFGTPPVQPPVMPRPSGGILDTAYNTQQQSGGGGLFSNPMMMMFMFPEMGEMMGFGGENPMMTFFLMQQMMNRRPRKQPTTGGPTAIPYSTGLPPMSGTGSQASAGGSPNIMDMLNNMGPPPGASAGLPALPGAGGPTPAAGGAPNIMDILNSMGPPPATPGGAAGPGPTLDFASMVGQPPAGGMASPAAPGPTDPMMNDFMNMISSGSQTGTSTGGAVPGVGLQADPFASLG